MTAHAAKLKVGISIHLRQGQQSIWENGIFQNCVFLVQLLNASPAVKKVVLVNGGDALLPSDAMMLNGTGISIVSLTEAMQSLDVMVEMSALIAEDWAQAFRDRGGKLVWMRVGNDYVIDMERAMFDKPPGALCSNKVYDAIWTLPEYEKSCKDYFEITARAPVRIVPHLWTPYFLERGISSMSAGLKYGYQPGKPRWRACCFEPNVCMVKTCHMPMLVCEEAYRANPKFLEALRVCNALQLKQHYIFESFARRLDIVNHAVATFEGRFPMYEFMANYGDCIVSHHWENGQNYLYYEALYGGYPLVHNSEFIRDYGYYYPSFDSQAGGAVMLDAFASHDANLDHYRTRASELLATLDVHCPANIQAYTHELRSLFAPKA